MILLFFVKFVMIEPFLNLRGVQSFDSLKEGRRMGWDTKDVLVFVLETTMANWGKSQNSGNFQKSTSQIIETNDQATTC